MTRFETMPELAVINPTERFLPRKDEMNGICSRLERKTGTSTASATRSWKLMKKAQSLEMPFTPAASSSLAASTTASSRSGSPTLTRFPVAPGTVL